MPRNYGRTATSIWRDKDFLKRSPEARFVFMMLFNQDNISAAGMLELTPTRWARYTGYGLPAVMHALEELEQHDYIVTDADTEELFVRTFVKWDGGMGNDLRRRAIRNAAGAIASDRIRLAVGHQLDRIGIDHSLVSIPPEPVDNSPGNRPSIPASDAELNSVSNGSRDGLDTRRVVVKEGDHQLEPQPVTATREGEALSADASAGPPPMNCSKHPDGTEEACGPCGTARKRYAVYVAAKLEREVEAKRAVAEARRLCPDCDDRGIRLDPKTRQPLGRCDHPSLVGASP